MSFDYDVLTEEECEKERSTLMDPGVYNFQVVGAEFKMSNSGKFHDPNKPSNKMISLKLMVWDHAGKEHIVYDNLIAIKSMTWKTKHFCDSVGLTEEYMNKQFNEHRCIGKCGKVSIIIQKGQTKPDGTVYKDKNAVDDYVMTDKGAIKFEPPKNTLDDDIPF